MRYKRIEIKIAAELETLADQVKQAIGDAETVTAGEYKISYKTVTSSRLDTTSIKRALPDLAAQFTKQTVTKRFSIM